MTSTISSKASGGHRAAGISRNSWPIRELAHKAGTRLDLDLDKIFADIAVATGGGGTFVPVVSRHAGRQRGQKNTCPLRVCEKPCLLMAQSVNRSATGANLQLKEKRC
jgi:hypothetical protein